MAFEHSPVRLAGSELSEHRHVCAFFRSPDERYRALIPYIREGITQGERACHVLPADTYDAHLAHLAEAGLDVPELIGSGQLDVRTCEELYGIGRFEPDRIVASIDELLNAGRDAGYERTRLIGHAQAALESCRDLESWVGYEARVDQLLERHPDPVICVYDAWRSGAGIAMDVLRTHPVAIVGGIVGENPFYVRPDELLRGKNG